MLSTMGDEPLTIRAIFEHGQQVYAESEVATFDGAGVRRASFAEVAERAERLAAALRRLGIRAGERVGTFAWNNQEHLEAYFAVPCMGAVLHTLNIRLFPEQLAYVINHAEDRAIIVDASVVPLLARVKAQLQTVEHIIVVGEGDVSGLGEVLHYEELLAAEAPGFEWPTLDEREAAAMCYTSGTTGNPKGVVYSHRSTYLHSMAANSASILGITEQDKVLLIVPMFHANAWGVPYAGWFVGTDMLMPQQFLQPEPLTQLIAQEQPTVSCAVPTVWSGILAYGEEHEIDLSSLRNIVCGGSAVPRTLMEQLEQRYGVQMIQGWGMTETSPLGAVAYPPRGTDPADEMDWRAKTGRIVAGIELRLSDDDGNILPWDGKSVGEIEVRGPWVTGSYYKEPTAERFHDGWLRTGDVGCVDAKGFIQITDRSKDVIKSGGEWISSLDLENLLMGHPAVLEAAVIGIPDARWDERPLACIVLRKGASATPEEMRTFLTDQVARWWLPEHWSFLEEVPKTSVGKFDKKVLRALYAEDKLSVVHLS